MCISPVSSFPQTASAPSPSIPRLENPLDFSLLSLPSYLPGFQYTYTALSPRDETGRLEYVFGGGLDRYCDDVRTCPRCGRRTVVKSKRIVLLRHIPIGGWRSFIEVEVVQMECPHCGKTYMQNIPFKALHHRITQELYQLIVDMLSMHQCTIKYIAEYTGVSKNAIKDIDFDRLKKLYTTDGTTIKKPVSICKYLAIDEFLLHSGHKYATHIIDLETWHILYVARGKKKEVVYNFIDTVGLDWMKNVEVVACDMNSDFKEAFLEKCPHIKIVYDHFHIVENLNKYINNIRKDEQKRLIEEGRDEEAATLKGTKYILTANRGTLEQRTECKSKDDDREIPIKIYENLLQQNRLFLFCDFIKESLKRAFSTLIREEMLEELEWIIQLCEESENKHLIRFGKMIKNHIDGIVTHTEYKITSGKIEGINNKIKTIRRMSYGIPSDDYFFLKLLDINANSGFKHPLFRIKGKMVFTKSATAA